MGESEPGRELGLVLERRHSRHAIVVIARTRAVVVPAEIGSRTGEGKHLL